MHKESHKLLSKMAAFIAVVGFFASTTSHAFLINNTTPINTLFAVSYLLSASGTDGNGNLNVTGQDISADVLFKLLEFDEPGNIIRLELTATNTTVDNGVQIGLQKLAFATNPAAFSVLFVDAIDGEFITAKIGADPEVKNAVGGQYLDIQTETGNGAGNRLLEGESDTFELKITFTNLELTGTIFDPFSSKWQSDKGSYEFSGTGPGPGPGPGPGVPVPEPTPLLLIMLGGLLLLRISRGKHT